MDYRVMKDNELFLLTDKAGDIPPNHSYGLGLYKKDTRFLSDLSLTINGEKPILLSSEADSNYISSVLLTNPHITNGDKVVLWRESIEIKRVRFLYHDVFYETIKVKSYHPKSVDFSISLSFEADFSDMFIVRGFQNGKVGQKTGQTTIDNSITLTYEGSDENKRETNISWETDQDTTVVDNKVTIPFSLSHQEEKQITFKICPSINNDPIPNNSVEDALAQSAQVHRDWNKQLPTIKTDHLPFQRLINRGFNDLHTLLTDVGQGKFPVAGLPWFGVPFGRDSLIAALQLLPFQPEIAKGTLRTMAHYQGKVKDEWRDEEPGKIMHEIRYGELANTNQIPFNPYYGTIDATPLFLVLMSEYLKWTDDIKFLEELLPNIEAALSWIDEYGDRDGDGFVEYFRGSSKGIANQGWKDSEDSIVHRNGDLAHAPIALAEVQGYVYHAKTGMADFYEAINKHQEAQQLKEQAVQLKQNFDEKFWMENQNFYAIALDKEKKQVGTLTSNPGHALFSGLIKDNRINSVVDSLTSGNMFSGFGIRTMGEGEAGYNPMSYHDGSVWPHDNSMILLGMGKVGKQKEAMKVIEGLAKAAGHFEYDRLPELFCGYNQSLGKPVPYPVACSPQAWAAGAPLTFIQTMLGLFPDRFSKELELAPALMDGMNELHIEDLPLGEGKLSFSVIRGSNEFTLDIKKNSTGFSIKQNHMCSTV
ncbi:amylo-alpha-1,6-glucosidase [Halobacillus hunanensis]|uniref:amylo-alpha-1,6-glucosidase n=1 Tax=Halobacillus hunanensis TaxID=578214 RepID=UPI0009A560A3|nr:amylo-alpha-1,6-glucosidase [Halobacillus hunanensis]